VRIGMIGLGRMGGNMVRRLLTHGHEVVAYDQAAAAVESLAADGAEGATSLADVARRLAAPRVVWIMLPAAAVDGAIAGLAPSLDAGDVVVDGGNSYYLDDIRRTAELAERGVHYVDVGTSGGVFGLERGYCLMIGGDPAPVARLESVFEALAPARDTAPPTPGREGAAGTAERGYLHCGPSGAGHFVKMVHNGIEYGLMAAYAEGFAILRRADAGSRDSRPGHEAPPLRHPEHYRYDLDVVEIAELWRRGSVVSSWLLDLLAEALLAGPDLEAYGSRVADSGEGRWTLKAAIDTGVPAPVLSAALHARFTSRGESAYADKLLSALRAAFGGHV
jgi:6-phosphogluconate dehydrogenase